ncbi:hypothetical protein SESBI_39458 [Sesbania bispinosa]|nr:hypothetical protein SESBI_39458 [Sesbania bispinosa]
MASRYDLICNVDGGSEHKIWRIKVRVIRLWRSSYFKDNNNKPMIELVVLDEQGGHIQCTVKSIHVYLLRIVSTKGEVFKLSWMGLCSIVKNVSLIIQFCDKGGDKNRHPERLIPLKIRNPFFKVQVALIQDNSELLSQFTESSDLLKDNLSVSCDNGVDTPSPLLPTGKTASNMDSSVIKVLDVDLAEYCGNASLILHQNARVRCILNRP